MSHFGSEEVRRLSERFAAKAAASGELARTFGFLGSQAVRARHLGAIEARLPPAERETWGLTVADLDWVAYLEMFLYGLSAHVLGGRLLAVVGPVGHIRRTRDVNRPVGLGPENFAHVSAADRRLYDLTWARANLQRYEAAGFPTVLEVGEMQVLVLGSEAVRAAVRHEAEKQLQGSRSVEQAEARARAIARRMFAGDSTQVFMGFAVFLRKLWRRLYDVIQVKSSNLDRIRELSRRGTVVLLPTHRSYMDFLVVSFVCFACQLPLPFIASGEDFLGILFVRYVFRQSRAFFLRRSFLGGRLSLRLELVPC